MSEICVVCRTPIEDSKSVKVTFYDREGPGVMTKKSQQFICHIARKCTDKLPLNSSQRAEMDRIIALELDSES